MKHKILIVEDERDDIDTLLGIVHKDFEVLEKMSFDPYDIVNIIKENKDIKIVILDLYEMNDKGCEERNGIDVLKEIRKNFTEEELPVVIYTTKSKVHLADTVLCLQEGAQDWIWKDPDLMSGPEKKARINKAIAKAKIDSLKDNAVVEQIKKRDYIFKVYAGCLIAMSSILMLFGLRDNNYTTGAIIPTILLITLGVTWNLIGKVKVNLKAEDISISAEISQTENELK